MPRTPRPIVPNATYFITSTAYGRRRWFADPDLAQIVVDQWRHYEAAYRFSLEAYCVMPDHYHAVLNVGERKTISQILHATNSYVATLVNVHLGPGQKIRIWQGRPWDEVIRDEEMYRQKVAYVLLNPWRQGLVQDPLQAYPFSNIDVWLQREGEEAMRDLFSRYRRRME